MCASSLFLFCLSPKDKCMSPGTVLATWHSIRLHIPLAVSPSFIIFVVSKLHHTLGRHAPEAVLDLDLDTLLLLVLRCDLTITLRVSLHPLLKLLTEM